MPDQAPVPAKMGAFTDHHGKRSSARVVSLASVGTLCVCAIVEALGWGGGGVRIELLGMLLVGALGGQGAKAFTERSTQ